MEFIPDNKKLNIISKILYYNVHDFGYGEGFYPQLNIKKCEDNNCNECKDGRDCNKSYDCIIVDFELMKYNDEVVWVQKTERNINGIDGTTGSVLLNSLNERRKTNVDKIFNKIGTLLYPIKPKMH